MQWDEIQGDIASFAELAGRRLLDIGVTILVAAAIYLVSGFVRRRIRSYAESKGRDNNNFASLIDNTIRIAVYIILTMMALTALGVDSTALVTFAGLFTAALTLSLQDVLRNIFCGLYLLAEQPFRPGDRIRVLADEGRVERVDLRVTRLRNDRQELILIPNQTVFNQVVGNRSTRRFRPYTVQLSGIDKPFSEAEAGAIAALREQVSQSIRVNVHLLKSSPEGCDLEITVRRTESEAEQQAIAVALVTTFPAATFTVIAR